MRMTRSWLRIPLAVIGGLFVLFVLRLLLSNDYPWSYRLQSAPFIFSFAVLVFAGPVLVLTGSAGIVSAVRSADGGAVRRWFKGVVSSGVVAGGLILSAFVATFFWWGQSGRWPKITDPTAIRAESAALIDEFRSGRITEEEQRLRGPGVMMGIDEAKWPAAILALRPRFVVVGPEQVTIWISTGGIDAGWGYAVYADTATLPLPCEDPPECGPEYLWETDYERIYQWEGFEG